jgi:hypothetical protein
MGFGWMAKSGPDDTGGFEIDLELADGGDGRRGHRPTHTSGKRYGALVRRSSGPGRHAQPKERRQLLGGLGIAGIYPRPLPRPRAGDDQRK